LIEVECYGCDVKMVTSEQWVTSSRDSPSRQWFNGKWFIVSYDSANKQKHYKKPLH